MSLVWGGLVGVLVLVGGWMVTGCGLGLVVGVVVCPASHPGCPRGFLGCWLTGCWALSGVVLSGWGEGGVELVPVGVPGPGPGEVEGEVVA